MSTAPAQTDHRASARERLLDAANELFYAEGVQTVGSTASSSGREWRRRRSITSSAARRGWWRPTWRPGTSHDQQAHRGDRRLRRSAPEDHGCLRRPDTPIQRTRLQRLRLHRRLYRGALRWACRACRRPVPRLDPRHVHRPRRASRCPRPGQPRRQLQLVYDGAGLAARMDHRDPRIAPAVHNAAQALLDATLPLATG